MAESLIYQVDDSLCDVTQLTIGLKSYMIKFILGKSHMNLKWCFESVDGNFRI